MNTSVLIPVYNKEASIPRVLAALVSQVGPGDEVVVLEDGSEDDSRDVLRAYEPGVRVIDRPRSEEQKGYFRIASGRNLLVAMAKHEHLVFLSGDCKPREDFLQLHKQAMMMVEERTIVRGMVKPGQPFVDGYSDDWQHFITGNIGIRKSDFILIGGMDDAYDGSWGSEDIDFGFRAVKRYGYRLFCIKAFVDHISHPRRDQLGVTNSRLFASKHSMKRVGDPDGRWEPE